MASIMSLAEKHNLKIIEDCAQAHGARYKDRSVGSIGHAGAWSFCQDKIMTTGGEGGMVTTNDETLWRTMWAYKDHGKSYEAVYDRSHPPGFRWLHESFGTNWRMLEIQAAIGRIQLRRMPEWSKIRKSNALALEQALRSYAGERGGIRLPFFPHENCEHANYRFYAYIRPENLSNGWNRDRIIQSINAEGVPCYYGSCSEVYMEKAFDNTNWRPKNHLPAARLLGETTLMFLVHPTLKNDEIEKTCSVTTSVLERATSSAGL
jgi:dTDP-4-amino-4,6-dideoxygalactose transaminase